MIVFDVGNTDTVIGIFKGGELDKVFRIRSLKNENAVYFEYRILNFFLENNYNPTGFTKAVLSSVVPQLTDIFVAFCEKFMGITPVKVDPVGSGLLRISIDNGSELGSDLFANALAAHMLYQDHAIVVDFGTALTFTMVNREGEILGVCIVPGLKTAVRALFSNTSLLPEVKLELPETVIGKNSLHSIRSGILFGYDGLVRGLLKRIREEMGGHCKVIATGGLSLVIDTLQDEFDVVDRDLTLKGIYIYGTHQR